MTPEQFQQEIEAFEILIIYGILKAEIINREEKEEEVK